MTDLTAELKAKAIGVGFDLVGVARAGPARSIDRLRAWLDAGMHGEMGYMARTTAFRSDPGMLLSGCRSVVAVAMSYRTGLPDSTGKLPGDAVWVSRYAWGRDYHKLLKRRLVRLGRSVRWRRDELLAWLEAGCPARDRWEALREARR